MKAEIDQYPVKIEMTVWEVEQVKKALKKAADTSGDEDTRPLAWLLGALEEATALQSW